MDATARREAQSSRTDLAYLPAVALAQLVRQRKIGAIELLEMYLRRIDRFDGMINAVVVKDYERARATARVIDESLLNHNTTELARPLLGVPMTVKESFDIAGLPTTFGLPELLTRQITTDASAVQRLRSAGAVIFGKTNVPALLADWQTFNPIYGTTSNPWDLERTPGGSSGGAAAAVAAGLCGLDFGSDIAGSIRGPAHYCGVYGHKPTFGIVDPLGHGLNGVVATADINAIGPLARSADDLETALRATAGPNAIDGAGWILALPQVSPRALHEFRVAVLLTDSTADVDESVQASLVELAGFLRKRGAKVSDRARPAFDFGEAHRVFIQLLRSATSGHQTDDQFDLLHKIGQTLPRGDSDYYAQMVRGNTLTHRDWLRANELRQQMRRAWAAFFGDWDVLLCPAAATAAFLHDQAGERWTRMLKVNGSPQPSTTQMFWAGLTGMSGLPATVAPMGCTLDGLPVGVQIIGPSYADLRCIHFARLLEREYRAFQRPPANN
jgi:amidase